MAIGSGGRVQPGPEKMIMPSLFNAAAGTLDIDDLELTAIPLEGPRPRGPHGRPPGTRPVGTGAGAPRESGTQRLSGVLADADADTD